MVPQNYFQIYIQQDFRSSQQNRSFRVSKRFNKLLIHPEKFQQNNKKHNSER